MSESTITTAGHDLPTRKLIIGLLVIAMGTLGYFATIKPAVHDHTVDQRLARRADCSPVPEATETAILAGLTDLGDRVVRSLRARPSSDGWWMVSADIAEPTVPRGFTGDLTTWRVRDDGTLVIEAVDRNAEVYSSFPAAPDDVKVEDDGGFDSRWCARDAALNRFSRSGR